LLKAVSELLDGSPGLKGRQIAKELGLDKSQVNSFLHKNQDTFVKNSNHEWCLIRAQHVEIDFGTGWIDEKAFESAIGKLAYQKDATKVTFKSCCDPLELTDHASVILRLPVSDEAVTETMSDLGIEAIKINHRCANISQK